MSDGLSQFAQRARRTREIPPPRHFALSAHVQLASVPPQESGASELPADLGESASPAPKTAITEPTPGPKSDLKVVTVYRARRRRLPRNHHPHRPDLAAKDPHLPQCSRPPRPRSPQRANESRRDRRRAPTPRRHTRHRPQTAVRTGGGRAGGNPAPARMPCMARDLGSVSRGLWTKRLYCCD